MIFKKNSLYALVIFALLLSGGCMRTVETTITREREGISTIKKIKSRNSGWQCKRKEITWVKDSIRKLTLSKEIKTYDCRGAYSRLVSDKKWIRKKGKLVPAPELK